MPDFPLISVITASMNVVSGNRSASFEEMVHSVEKLGNFCPVEHLIQDGGSLDGSLELYARYGSGLRVISHPDSGVYDGMNQGAQAAKGKYLAFLNTDDLFHAPENLAALLEEMEQKNAAYAFSSVRRIRRDGRIEEKPAKMYSIFSRMPYCHQTLIVRKDVFERLGGYDTAFRIVADHDFALRLYLAKEPFICGKRSFATFRSGGISRNKEKNHQERAAIFKKTYGGFYNASEEEFLKLASGGRFPWKLVRQLLKLARPEERPRMLWFYLCACFQ